MDKRIYLCLAHMSGKEQMCILIFFIDSAVLNKLEHLLVHRMIFPVNNHK
jgi:hypothetical protein